MEFGRGEEDKLLFIKESSLEELLLLMHSEYFSGSNYSLLLSAFSVRSSEMSSSLPSLLSLSLCSCLVYAMSSFFAMLLMCVTALLQLLFTINIATSFYSSSFNTTKLTFNLSTSGTRLAFQIIGETLTHAFCHLLSLGDASLSAFYSTLNRVLPL